ncbi:EspB family ESX-1 secretion system-associated protein [Mycobacterium montefiorense]|uniref:PPE domain-containing protein n=1 Tax=Mycobacterium montefiorense TaxID=154654 RepID=UPI0021DD974E|nr:hypothetical protein [Mycobacterium montefiorense]MCV7429639.1 hypothetical protein [Mycobacterium montefiorense]GLE52934.1 ESX-1 secretion-associated protein EspB [Mycobacterium montefiorense]
MPQTLKVEYEELIARANEIEAALPPIPATNPAAPCPLSFVNDAATQLALSADSLRLYLRACEREWRALAKSLRNAAKAYEEVDEESAEGINAVNGDSSVGTAGAGNGKMTVNCDPDEDFGGYLPPPPPPQPPPSFEYPYYEVRQAATEIESGDQGTAFKAFAKEWDTFQREFQKETYRFRPFTSWEGESTSLVEENFEAQRQWIYAMAKLCVTLGNDALRVVSAHKKARVLGDELTTSPVDGTWTVEAEHPTTYEVSLCDYWYKYYTTKSPYYLYMAVSWYESLQLKSETSLNTYIANASLPLTPVNPKMPPTATRIAAPDPNAPGDEEGTIDDPFGGGGGGGGGGLPAAPMMPMLPTMPGAGMGGAPDQAAMTEAMKDAMKGKPGGPGGGLKPASLGGGGGGVPSMPLQPAVDSEAASRPAGASPGAAATGRGMPGAGGAAGGGMGGGMAPMGGAGQGQNQGKGKRVQSEDESLYTEERAWTEGVIGNRPRKTPPDK